MPSYVTAHFYNAVPGKESELAAWFEKEHAPVLPHLHGFKSVERYELTKEQLPPGLVHIWSHMTVYDFEFTNPEIHVPALGSFLVAPRERGLIKNDGSENIWSYGMYGGWLYSRNYTSGKDLSHVMMLPANYIQGREAEYHKWYDEVHTWEVANTPGYVSFRRGGLLPYEMQIQPRTFVPGSQLILAGMQTNDLPATLKEFTDRGTGKAGPENHGPRSTSASLARTVHVFKRLSTFKA